MTWFHGEMALEDGQVTQFRYSTNEPVTAVQFISVIQDQYMKDSVVLWIEEGFTPRDPSRWDPDLWLIEEPDWSQGTIGVEKQIP